MAVFPRVAARTFALAVTVLPLLGVARQDAIRDATAEVTPIVQSMEAARDRVLAAPVASCRRRIAMSALRELPPTKADIVAETALPAGATAPATPPPDPCTAKLTAQLDVLTAYARVLTAYASGLARASGHKDVALGLGDLETAVKNAKALKGVARGIPAFLDDKTLDLVANGGADFFANHVRAERIAQSVRRADPAIQRLALLFADTFGVQRDCDPALATTARWCSVFFSETKQMQSVFGALLDEIPARAPGPAADAHELLLRRYAADLVERYRAEKAARDADLRAGADLAGAVTEFARLHAHVLHVVDEPVAPSTAIIDRF